MIRVVVIVIALALTATTARAQVAVTPAAWLGAGFEHGGVLEAGYRRPVPRLAGGGAQVRAQLPSVPGLGEGGLELAITTGRAGDHGWGGTATVGAAARWVDGALLGVAQGGLMIGGAAGYFRPRGRATVELAWEHSLVTYVRPTARYRDLIYADAGAGLYGSGGGLVRGGVAASLVASPRLELTARAGYLRTERLAPAPGLPFYAVLGAAVRL